jgi:formylglycine-generating enzyme required for sulfatase activity
MTYRLPTEAEWEHACRAGTTTAFWCGDALTTDQANYNGNFPYPATAPTGVSRETTTPVRQFRANPWGLYDMYGNLYQWCSDRFADYPAGPVDDPMGPDAAPDGGNARVLRGGSWCSAARCCRSAYRVGSSADHTDALTGFRVAVTPP